jgi:thiamine biosynthesis protein ThiS
VSGDRLPATVPLPIVKGMDAPVTLTLNGERRMLSGPVTVAALLASLGLDRRKVAVERNEAIVPRSLYDSTALASGDTLEIVHFIGGG